MNSERRCAWRVQLNKNMTFEVFTDRVHRVKLDAPSEVQTADRMATPAGERALEASVSISSEPPGADILLDGQFVGSTPSTIQMNPGPHTVVVKRAPKCGNARCRSAAERSRSMRCWKRKQLPRTMNKRCGRGTSLSASI
jgi:hypothetical protein